MKQQNKSQQLSFPQAVEQALRNNDYDQARDFINQIAGSYNDLISKQQALSCLRHVHESLYNSKQWDACSILEETGETLLGDIHFFDTSS